MKKGIKILLIVLAVIVSLAVIIWLLYMWKINKDINDMKKVVSKALQNAGVDKKTADKKSGCYIDKLVKAFGYIRTKEIFNGDKEATSDEAAKMSKFNKDCGTGFF